MANLASDPTITGHFFANANTEYRRFKTDRDTINFDEKCLTADGMFRCFRNSDLADQEKATVTGKDADTELPTAKMASIRFFRLVMQKAGLFSTIINAAESPFKYTPIANPEVFQSAQEGLDQAAIHSVLAKYAWKKDEGADKMHDFAVQLGKYSNVPLQIIWHAKKSRVKLWDHTAKKHQWKEVTTHVYPSFRVLPWSMLFADIYSGPIANQRCVVVLSLVSWKDIQSAEKLKWFDAEQVDIIRQNRKQYRWDGMEGADFKREQALNEAQGEYNPGDSDLFLQWDVYQFSPITGKEWDDKADYTLYWGTAIGNALPSVPPSNDEVKTSGDEPTASNTAIPVRLITDFDPDGEIPIFMSNALPDDQNLLYHIMWSETVRPQYAAECTLWEQTIENNHGINNPFIAFDSMKFNSIPSSFRFGRGSRVDIQDPRNSITEFPVRSTLAENISLINAIQGEQETASNSSKNQMGQEFGGRTPATEGLQINRFTQQPTMAEARYALGRTFKWLARKYKSYWQGFAPQELIKAIADEGLSYPVYVTDIKDKEKMPEGTPLYGDFDVQVTVLDEFVEDFVQAQQELQLLQTIGASPILQKSKNHQIDFGYWVRSILHRLKVKDSARIVLPISDSDGHLRQRDELRQMLETGEIIQPQQGEDHGAHISECEAEILRWKPVLSATVEDPDLQAQQTEADTYINQLVIPHRDAHKQMMQQGEQANEQGGSPPAQNPVQTQGQVAGQAASAAFGG